MPVYKRGKTYWVDVSAPDGTRIRKTTGTADKVKAQEYHDKLKHDLWQMDKLNKQPERYFEEVVILALRDAEGQSCYVNKQIYARYFLGLFRGRKLSSIRSEEIMNSLPDYNPKTKRRLSGSTKNRYLAFIMRGISLAQKMGWPVGHVHTERSREPKVRVRWLEQHQAIALINSLANDWMRNVVSFALLTGARKTEILSLEWKHVDLSRRVAIITASKAKSGRGRAIPLNDDAVNILSNIPREGEYVFGEDGKQRNDIYRHDFRRAMDLSGIDDFRFHDLRHTWASWHVQNGTPLMVLKEMGGWEKLEMVNKYAHLSGEHLARYSNVVTFLAQKENQAGKECHLSLLTG
ncbi:site-specific integrase [Morganella morganii]